MSGAPRNGELVWRSPPGAVVEAALASTSGTVTFTRPPYRAREPERRHPGSVQQGDRLRVTTVEAVCR